MTNRPFDQQVIPVLQRPTSNDLNIGLSLLYYSMMFMQEIALQWGSASSPIATAPLSGFIGSGFMARANGIDMTVTLAAGLGFIYNNSDIQTAVLPSSGQTVVGVSDLSALKPVALKADTSFTAPPADPASDRYDIIECRIDRHYADSTVLDFFDTGTDQFVPGPAFKTFSRGELDTQTGTNLVYNANSTAGLSYKVGQVGAGVPPATSTDYVRIAIIKVAAAVTAVPANCVVDARRIIAPGMTQRVNLRCQGTATAGVPDTVLNGIGGPVPPGVQVASRYFSSGGLTYWRFYVFAGYSPGIGSAQVTPLFSTTNIMIPTGYLRDEPIVTTVDSTLQMALASNGSVTPHLVVAVGQPYVYFDVVLQTFEQASNVFTQALFPGVFNFNVSFDLRFDT